MTGTRAVMLGFAAVALVLVAAPAFFVWALVHYEPPQPGEMDGSISQAFLADEARQPTFEAASVPDVERLLPAGTPVDVVRATLAANGFACKSADRRAICAWTVDWYSERDEWSVTLALDTSGRVLSCNARRQRASL